MLVSVIVAIGALQNGHGDQRCLKTKEKRETEIKRDTLLIFALIVAMHTY